MNWAKKRAIDYCHSIGADPFEVVGGYWDGNPEWVYAERWCWYQ